MTALLDDLGTWIELGTVSVITDWLTFPVAATQGYSSFRLTWQGDFARRINSRYYLRSLYIKGGSNVVDSQWQRIYPSADPQIIALPFSPEFYGQQLERFIEVRKAVKYKSLSYWSTSEPVFSLNLQEFSPYPETIAAINNQSLSPSTIDELSSQLIEQIKITFPSLNPPPNTLPPNLL
jgi:hypothetical protein